MSIPDFVQMMTHTLNIRKRERNVNGDFYDLLTFTDLKGFVEYGNHFVTTDKDEKIESTAIVYFKDDCPIDINWDYWMIDQTKPYSRNNLEVIKIDSIDHPLTGLRHHFEIHVR